MHFLLSGIGLEQTHMKLARNSDEDEKIEKK